MPPHQEVSMVQADGVPPTVALYQKHLNAIFGKLGLSEEPQLHRRVAAVLAFLRDAGRQPQA